MFSTLIQNDLTHCIIYIDGTMQWGKDVVVVVICTSVNVHRFHHEQYSRPTCLVQNSTCSVIRKKYGGMVVSTERDRQQVSCIQNTKLFLHVLQYGRRFTAATALGGTDALRTRLNLGLHHFPLLRRGRCNPIPAREPV